MLFSIASLNDHIQLFSHVTFQGSSLPTARYVLLSLRALSASLPDSSYRRQRPIPTHTSDVILSFSMRVMVCTSVHGPLAENGLWHAVTGQTG